MKRMGWGVGEVGGGQTATAGLRPLKLKTAVTLVMVQKRKKISELANGSAFVNEHLTKKNHLTTHMIVSKTPLTPEADNAKFKSYHLGTSVQCNCLSTATTHVKDILPLQKRTSQAIKRSSRTYTAAHIGPLCLLLVYHDKEQLIHSAHQEISACMPLFIFLCSKIEPCSYEEQFCIFKENKASPDFLSLRCKQGGKNRRLCWISRGLCGTFVKKRAALTQ